MTVDTKALQNIIGPEAMMRKMSGSDEIPDGMNKEIAKGKEMRKDTPPKYVAIPDKYAAAKTSGLKVAVDAGANTKDLPLTD